MFRFLLCLFGLHGATEIDFNESQNEIQDDVFYTEICRDCNKRLN